MGNTLNTCNHKYDKSNDYTTNKKSMNRLNKKKLESF